MAKNDKAKKENCSNCRYMKAKDDGPNFRLIICTRYPPQGLRPSLFPETHLDWDCGEYKA